MNRTPTKWTDLTEGQRQQIATKSGGLADCHPSNMPPAFQWQQVMWRIDEQGDVKGWQG